MFSFFKKKKGRWVEREVPVNMIVQKFKVELITCGGDKRTIFIEEEAVNNDNDDPCYEEPYFSMRNILSRRYLKASDTEYIGEGFKISTIECIGREDREVLEIQKFWEEL